MPLMQINQGAGHLDPFILYDNRFWVVVAAFLLASIVGPYIKRFVFGPKLKVTFFPLAPCVVTSNKHNDPPKHPTTNNPVDYTSTYVRLKVTSTKWSIAQDCRGYLSDIQTIDGPALQPTEYHDYLPLNWAFSGLRDRVQKERVKDDAISLPQDISDYLDVAAVFKDYLGKPNPALELQSHFLPVRYKDIIKPDVQYLITVVITAADAKSVVYQLLLKWGDSFDSLRVAPYDGPTISKWHQMRGLSWKDKWRAFYKW